MAAPVRNIPSWSVTANADNATATATKAAPSGARQHYVTSISGSFDTSVSGALLQLKDDTTEIGRWYVYDAFALTLVAPIRISPAKAVNLVLAASGTGGVVGAATLTGYTE